MMEYERIRKKEEKGTGEQLRKGEWEQRSEVPLPPFHSLPSIHPTVPALCSRTGGLSFDGMKLRSGVYWNADKQRIVGLAHNFYEHPDVMKLEFQRAAAESSGAVKSPELAKDYLVFYFSSFDPTVSCRFPVARYCLNGVTPAFLVSVIPMLIAELDGFGFIVGSVTGDGAGENRAALKALATTSASTFLVDMKGQKISVFYKDEDDHHDGVVTGVPARGRVQVLFENG